MINTKVLAGPIRMCTSTSKYAKLVSYPVMVFPCLDTVAIGGGGVGILDD